MGMLRVLSRRSSDRVAWDTRLGELGAVDAPSPVREARWAFRQPREPTSEQIVMAPRDAGG